MSIQADSNGNLSGKFTIPAGIRSGSKAVTINGAGGSVATGSYYGQGALVSQVLQNVAKVTQTYYDPIAQTFSLLSDTHIGGIDLLFTAVGTTDVSVQIRETQTGYPTRTILAETKLKSSQITAGDWQRFTFTVPLLAKANTEYAIVVLCNDAVSSLAIAELGKYDTTNQRWVTQQPYQVGVLLSSSNASTWTAHQDKDLAFRLLARSYTEQQREITLGTVAVTNASDLVVYPMADNPATGADSDLILTLPDGTAIAASDSQFVRMTTKMSGNIGVRARLRSNGSVSSVLYPGSQIVVGEISTSADYVSRAIDGNAAGCNVRVIYDGLLPSGSTATVFVSGVDAGDSWQSVPTQGVPVALGNGVYEYRHFIPNVNESRLRVKIVLSGTAAARPYLYNLRVSVTDYVA